MPCVVRLNQRIEATAQDDLFASKIPGLLVEGAMAIILVCKLKYY